MSEKGKKSAAEISETEITFLDSEKEERESKMKFINTRHENTQAHGDIPIHKFLFVSPSSRHKRIYQRRSAQDAVNKFLRDYIRRKYRKL